MGALLAVVLVFGGGGIAAAEEVHPSAPASPSAPTVPGADASPQPTPRLVAQAATGARIVGAVTRVGGAPLVGAVARAFEYTEVDDGDGGTISDTVERGSATAADNGTYEITGLPAGRYYVRFSAPGFVTLWWPDARDEYSGNLIDVNADQAVTAIDVALEESVAISGTVMGGDSPLADATVEAHLWNESDEYFDRVGETSTDEQGEYTLDGLPAGTYSLRFTAPGSGFVSEWWNDKPKENLADTFVVAAGQTATEKDAELALGATISGTVLAASGEPLAGVDVVPYIWDEVAGEYDTVGGDASTASIVTAPPSGV